MTTFTLIDNKTTAASATFTVLDGTIGLDFDLPGSGETITLKLAASGQTLATFNDGTDMATASLQWGPNSYLIEKSTTVSAVSVWVTGGKDLIIDRTG